MRLCPALLMTLFVRNVLAQDSTWRQEVFANLGWGNPLGVSLEYAADLGGGHVIGVGGGLSLAGGVYGLDLRRYFRTDGPVAPYLGCVVSKATGIDGFKVVSNKQTRDTAVYNLDGGLVATPRAGMRISISRLRLYFNGGYGYVVTGGGKTLVSGRDDENAGRLLDLFTLGGPEFSLSGGFAF